MAVLREVCDRVEPMVNFPSAFGHPERRGIVQPAESMRRRGGFGRGAVVGIHGSGFACKVAVAMR